MLRLESAGHGSGSSACGNLTVALVVVVLVVIAAVLAADVVVSAVVKYYSSYCRNVGDFG